MIINRSGITIRTPASGVRVMGRATQGVRLIRLNDSDKSSSVEKIENILDEDVETGENPDRANETNSDTES
jgi:DNA gyrase subunit A